MSHNTKYVFFGTPEFAAIVLAALFDAGYAPMAAVCNPDRPIGRKKIITPPPVKVLAQKHAIPVLQPETLSASDIRHLASDIDLFVVAAYAKILRKEILDIPRLGTIGVHPSLLPQYRGTTPIQTVLLNGEAATGTTLFLMDEKVDHGPIVAQRTIAITDDDNTTALTKKLADLSGALISETLPRFIRGEIAPRPQDESQASYTKKFMSEDGFVDQEILKAAQGGERGAISVWRKIRALNPEPGVYTIREDGKRVKLLGAELQGPRLTLTKIQEEGGRPRMIAGRAPRA